MFRTRYTGEEEDIVWDITNSGFFTGHRSKELGKCYLRGEELFELLKDKAKTVIEFVHNEHGISNWHNGLAQGWDTVAFYAVEELKEQGLDLKNIACVPFEHQPLSWVDRSVKERVIEEVVDEECKEVLTKICAVGWFWGKDTVEQYYDMLSRADEVVYVDKDRKYEVGLPNVYHVAKLGKRNEYMVDRSSTGIPLYNGSNGGTGSCVGYAIKRQRTLYILRPNTYDLEVMYGSC